MAEHRCLAPSPRLAAATAWTGKELIVWGGRGCSGGRCDNPAVGVLDEGAAYTGRGQMAGHCALAAVGPFGGGLGVDG